MTSIAGNLMKILAPLVKDGKVRVTQNALGISVEINASVLFAPGEAKLSIDSDLVLRSLAIVMKDDTHSMEIEGHTDNVPISNSLFPSNWELSSARASAVVRLFVDCGILPERMTVIGRSANIPVAENSSPENRARNRRVTILILSKGNDTFSPNA